MVTALSQLHINVIELTSLYRVGTELSQHHTIFTVYAFVIGILQISQANFDNSLIQGRNRIIYFLFESSQEMRLQNCVKFLDLIIRFQVTVLLQKEI